jgi:uncharacterized protein
MSRLSRFFLIVLFLFSAGEVRGALNLPPEPKTYVVDLAEILTPAEQNHLENILSELERRTSNQVLVVSIPDLQGYPVADYAIRLAEKWKPGQEGRDNGVILLVAPHEREVRIEVGYGLEGALPDATTKNIIEEVILPSFKRGNFFKGIEGGVSAIDQAIAGEYQPLGPKKKKDRIGKLIGFFIAVFIFFLLPFIFKGRRAYSYDRSGWHPGPYWGTGGRRGGGGFSSGGFGGFSAGGGSFGGGGASGS